MNNLCPTACAPLDLLENPKANCTEDLRRETIGRLFMFPCQTALPDPITDAGMKALWDSGDLVATSELVNFTPEAPQTEALQVSDWRPARDVINSRVFAFEDRYGISLSTGSPAVVNKFFDYDFWLDKLTNYDKINYMFAFNNGDVINSVDKNGNQLFSSLSGFIDYIRAQQQGGLSTETKKFKLTFIGDPLYFNKPSWNWITAGIVF